MTALFLAVVSVPTAIAGSQSAGVSVHLPSVSRPGQPFVVKVRLPPSAAAVDGRLLVERSAVDLWGVAPVGGGTTLRPEAIAGGYAFGAYGLRAVNGSTVVRLVMSSHTAGSVGLRVAVDAVADARGQRLAGAGITSATVEVAGGPHDRRAAALEHLAGNTLAIRACHPRAPRRRPQRPSGRRHRARRLGPREAPRQPLRRKAEG